MGFEPTRGCPQRCLRPPRLPFRHFGTDEDRSRGGNLEASHRRPGRNAQTHRRPPTPMLDSPRLATTARRVAPVVEDARPTEAVDDPVQRRDLILLEQARDGQPRRLQRPRRAATRTTCTRSSRAWSPTGTRPPTPCRRRSSPRTATCASFRGGSVRSWLSRIAINAAMDQQRLKKRRPVAALPGARGRELAAAGRRTRRTRSTPRCRASAPGCSTPRSRRSRPTSGTAIVLFDVEGYDYAEIAELTGVSLGTVKSRIHRGRLALRDRLEGSTRPVPGRGRLMPHLPDHQTDHDPLLIAAFAAGDAEGADLEQARDLVAACDDCAALHHDLRAIAPPCPRLPVPARPRDFRLTPEQAASIRPAGWRRLLAPLAGPRFAFAAPLGGSLAALGIAGILVAGAPAPRSRASATAPRCDRRRPPRRRRSRAGGRCPVPRPRRRPRFPAMPRSSRRQQPAVPVGGTGPAGGEPGRRHGAGGEGPRHRGGAGARRPRPARLRRSCSDRPSCLVLLFLGGVLVGLRLAGRRLGARTWREADGTGRGVGRQGADMPHLPDHQTDHDPLLIAAFAIG